MATMRIDLSNQRFGRLITIKRVIPPGESKNKWLCKCDCGNECLARTSDLRSGRTHSCGCLKSELDHKRNRSHGMSYTSLHKRWRSIKDRCFNPNNKSYKNYGGRGITMCSEWKNSFESFRDWALSNGYEESLTIERRNVNGNYEPSNCLWIPLKEQAKNRRSSHLLTFNGETHNIREWSKKLGIPENRIHYRIRNGWTTEETLTLPVLKKKGDKYGREKGSSNGR